MDTAGSVAGLISLGIQVTQILVDFYSAYKDQNSDIACTLRKLSNLSGVLESLREQTSRKFHVDEKKLLSSIEASVNGCELLIKELQHETEKFERTGSIQVVALTVGYQATYPLRRSTLLKLEENIDETVAHLSLALQVLGQKQNSSVQDDIEETKELLALIRSDQLSSTIQEWLKAPDTSGNYNQAYAKYHPGTGRWFVKGAMFTSWLTDRNSCIWITGFAGCGKSVLCSTAIRHVYRHRRSSRKMGISFFFFAFDDDSKQDASSMLRTLILQLSSQLRGENKSLCRLHDSYKPSIPPNQALLDCLRQTIRAFDDVYILLDALDESPRDKHRVDVLQSLVDILEWQEPGLHILITSRDEIDIREGLNIPQSQILLLKNESIDDDIASFISKRLRESKKTAIQNWEKHFDQIETALKNGANGVFRWVECQFSALESCPKSKRHLDRLLTSLPPSLDKTYERMLLNIDEEYIEDARRVLTLLACAKRPLTAPEIIEALAVELGDAPTLNPDGRLLDGDEILRLCPGFLELVPSSRSGRTTMRIAHFSVKEYLESERMHPIVRKFKVHRPEAHAEIASICLTYLMDPKVSKSTSWTQHPLRTYATTVWHQHYRDADSNLYQVEQQVWEFFRLTGSVFKTWARDYLRKGRLVSPVFYASYLGLTSLLSRLLEERRAICSVYRKTLPDIDIYINAQNGQHGTALQAASKQGHEAAVRILLREGANVNTVNQQDPDYATALEAASAGGHKEVVRLLLDHGAEVDITDQSALYMASKNGHEAIVQLLLEKGIDTDASERFIHSPLQAASYRGNHGTNINLKSKTRKKASMLWDDDWQTYLETASSRGLDSTILFLLKRGADINANRGIALAKAFEKGREGAVRPLLDKGARIDIKDLCLLSLACKIGHEAVIRTLLDKGVDVDGKDADGKPLQIAVRQGHEAIAVLLLERGANVNAQNKYGETALHEAAQRGHQRIMQLLIDKGANVNAQSRIYGLETALEIASLKGDLAIIQLLLDNGADINTTNGEALAVACGRGDMAMVKLLIDKGARLSGMGGPTPLEMASEYGHNEIVQLLLDCGADINVEGGALHAASSTGHEAIVRLLLDAGAEVNSLNSSGKTALHAASKKGHEAIVRLLLARGIEINAKSQDGETAVHEAIAGRHTAIAELLLSEGAKVDLNDKYDKFVLVNASENGYKTIVESLLSNRSATNAKLAVLLSDALHAASKSGRQGIVQQLIENGADPNLESGLNRLTTLAAASAAGHEAVVRLLLDNGANINQGKETALETAAKNGHREIVQLLLSKGAKIDTPTGNNALCCACSKGHEEVVRLLLNKGADLNACSSDAGRSALDVALAAGHTTVVRVLIDRGVDINIQCPAIRSPEDGYSEKVQVLLDAIVMRYD
ncbi:unnamed protein product [Clonostachys byssicola]|uniref:NACHT domain-containing protein n=1 Tax=Clonostachys byssicola TaxID=160290 RepID=A0A9N9YDN7_9HYPO|nr:unnamed protein product [Clonostachys byssicola]